MEKIAKRIQIATLPSRERYLKNTVHSLIDQCDSMFIALNNYDHIPEWLNHPKIECKLMDNSTGDGAKFYNVEKFKGYFFACDDDLIYPSDYVETMVNMIEKYDRDAIITNHGRIIKSYPVENYYLAPKITYHCLQEVDVEVKVHFGGTGVMAFHTDTIKIKYKDFKKPNMADIWLSINARDQKVPIITNPHSENWLKYQEVTDTIHERYHLDCPIQTNIVNKNFS